MKEYNMRKPCWSVNIKAASSCFMDLIPKHKHETKAAIMTVKETENPINAARLQKKWPNTKTANI